MSDRCVLVTGSSRGIGAALVAHFLNCGDLVAGCARGPAVQQHERYIHFMGDVSDEAHVSHMFAELRQRWGRLDVLVNNAGIARMNLTALMPLNTAEDIMRINFLGTFLSSRGALRLLRRSTAGRIVNFTTVAVPMHLEGEAVYAASKSAVETLTRILAREIAPWGITCNAVGPSPVRTALTQSVPDEAMARLLNRQAIRRWAEPDDVINVVDFFVRPTSGMVTGQIVYLAGVS